MTKTIKNKVTATRPVAAAILTGNMLFGGTAPQDTCPQISGHPEVPEMLRQGRERCRPCLRWWLLPGVSGRDSEVEKWEVKFLQLNLGRRKDIQDLLMQTAGDRGTNVLLNRRRTEGSIIDLTIAAPRLASRIGD